MAKRSYTRRKKKAPILPIVIIVLLVFGTVVSYGTNPTEEDFKNFVNEQIKEQKPGIGGQLLQKVKNKRISEDYTLYSIHIVEDRFTRKRKKYLGLFNRFILLEDGTEEENTDDK